MGAEKNFENKVKAYLKQKGAWFVKYWGGAAYTKSGVPDLLVCFKGRFLGIELKSPRGKVSDLQKHVLTEIGNAGGVAMVLYPDQFEDFKRFIEDLEKEASPGKE